MRIETVVAPAVEPVTLAEAKLFCRIDPDITEEDALIGNLIAAAREQAETHTGRAFAVQTLRYTIDGFPNCATIKLPRAPLIDVASIKYDDSDEVEQTLPVSEYTVRISQAPGSVYNSEGWPATTGAPGSVRIEYDCGYDPAGVESEVTPKRAIQAILFLVNHFYENRDTVIIGSITAVLPYSVQNLLHPLKLPRL